jgi:hypothetical protein
MATVAAKAAAWSAMPKVRRPWRDPQRVDRDNPSFLSKFSLRAESEEEGT